MRRSPRTCSVHPNTPTKAPIQPVYRVTTIAKALGMKSFPHRVRTWPPNLCYQDTHANWILTRDGARAFVASTRKIVPEWLLRELDVVEVTRMAPIETTTLSAIVKVFPDSKLQVSVGKYRVDCVIKDIVIECDEKGHSDRDPSYESSREQFLESMGYTVYRYNPDASGFDILDVIRDIVKMLL